ncbi:MAG: alpha/beta-type small acid-soluble spore protein [Gorillibacterium sp.]|nr:alpha/beta-type small acid-soluble spore protein [Gorillibacterium sp.]
MAKNKQIVVPQSKQMLDQWKYEIAAELGLPVGQGNNGSTDTEFSTELGSNSNAGHNNDYWGYFASRDNGAVGGQITKRLIEKAEETLFSLS